MTATFLHPRTDPPADEMLDQVLVSCEVCGKPMWLTKVDTISSAQGIDCIKSFECKSCGALQWLKTDRIV
jgi:hypothetical protein